MRVARNEFFRRFVERERRKSSTSTKKIIKKRPELKNLRWEITQKNKGKNKQKGGPKEDWKVHSWFGWRFKGSGECVVKIVEVVESEGPPTAKLKGKSCEKKSKRKTKTRSDGEVRLRFCLCVYFLLSARVALSPLKRLENKGGGWFADVLFFLFVQLSSRAAKKRIKVKNRFFCLSSSFA